MDSSVLAISLIRRRTDARQPRAPRSASGPRGSRVFTAHLGVEDIWASNHVLIMPSRFEGLPLAIVEAMLCGRPVIATDVAGHSEVIEDGVTGFLADAPTVPSMAEALERFWSRRADAQMIGETADSRIRQIFPLDPVRVFSDKLTSIYESMKTPVS